MADRSAGASVELPVVHSGMRGFLVEGLPIPDAAPHELWPRKSRGSMGNDLLGRQPFGGTCSTTLFVPPASARPATSMSS